MRKKEKERNNIVEKIKEKRAIVIIVVAALLLIGAMAWFFGGTERDIVTTDDHRVCGEDFTDQRDNNTYSTIKIGDLCWMQENLAYLPEVHEMRDESREEPRYYVYGYDGTNENDAKEEDNYRTYGVLYNFSAAKEVCPEGWRLATDDDFKDLESSIGMKEGSVNHNGWRGEEEGSKLSGREELWDDGELKNSEAFGDLEFNVLPGGMVVSGHFGELGRQGYFWASKDDNDNLWRRYFHYDLTKINRNVVTNKEMGFSVRCVKEE